MKKSIREMCKGLIITIPADPFNCRKFKTSEIGRGIGIINGKKGKGSYNRNDKHKGKGWD